MEIQLGFFPMILSHDRLWKRKPIISFGEMIARHTIVGLCQGTLIVKLGYKWHKPVLRSTRFQKENGLDRWQELPKVGL
jgi:hypothetical protein